MSKKVVTEVVCDDCGADATHESLPLSYDGKTYEIDLCNKCKGALDKTLNPILQVARKSRGTQQVATLHRRPTGASARGIDVKDVRAWAKKNNIKLPKRGRIPNPVLDKFQAVS